MLVDKGALSPGAHRWIESQVDHRRTRWALIGILGVSVAANILLASEFIRTSRAYAAREPYVVTLDSLGNAKALTAGQLVFTPTEALVRNHLLRFTHAYYARLHGQIAESQSEAYWFFHESISSKMAQLNRKEVSEFAKAERADETEVTVNNVIPHLEKQPLSADIYFTKSTVGQSKEVKSSEKWTAKVRFEFAPRIDPAMVPFNPLGLAITYIHQEKEF